MREAMAMESEAGIKRRLACSALLLLCAGRAQAGFLQDSPSAAAQAMAGTFAGKADDAGALFINPAGLAQLNRPEGYLLHSRPLLGLKGASLSQSALAAAVPAGESWTFALGANSFDAAGLLKEQEFLLGGAYKLNSHLVLGMSLGYLRRSYNIGGDPLAERDPVFKNGTSKGALGLDAGAIVTINSQAQLGFSARHLNRPDLGLSGSDRVPMTLRAGGLYRLERFNVLADLNLRDSRSGEAGERRFSWSAATEILVVKRQVTPSLLMRAGVNENQFTAGFGVTAWDLTVDYAFALFSRIIQDNAGGHTVALRVAFGGERVSGKEKRWAKRWERE
ncbi:MAG: hypothetical protein A2V88_02825 [Elusimicrobia bacterium RBG_16_66_12]|nr:MAG: hypothetical protein A2V88_02825 [Elusimicrobia bacterium RBG_16_66_12]